MQANFTFNETSPNAPGAAASAAQVAGSTQGATGILTANPGLDSYKSLAITASLIGATGGALDVYIQTSPDFGTTWFDYAHFPQLAAAAGAIKYTFAASTSGQLLVPAVVGANLAPALAANTIVGGAWGDRMRLVMVAGPSTTAGAVVKVQVVALKDSP